VGQGTATTIVLSAALVRGMTLREIQGILAHEIVHVRNGDIALMQLAMVAGRLTRLLSQIGLLLVFFSLFLRVVAVRAIPIAPLMILIVAPIAVSILQLALSRAREGEADLEAAELTGDPHALASALVKMRRHEKMLFRGRFPTVAPLRIPSLLRDHPATEERIRALLSLPQPPGIAPEDDTLPFTGELQAPGPWSRGRRSSGSRL